MSSLNNERALKSDKSNSMKYLESFPENCRFSFEQSLRNFDEKKLSKKYERFAFLGMGGSGVIGDIISDLFFDADITVFKDYKLPKYIGKDHFCIAISYSGNTEECLSLIKQAKERGLEYLTVFSDGKLSKFPIADGSFTLRVPPDLIPRFSLDHMLFSVLGFLHAMDVFDIKTSAEEAFKVLEGIKAQIVFSNNENNPSKEIAKNLKGKIPIIYAFGPYESVARRAKTQFNENSKVPSFYEIMPEADHNGIVGWASKKLGKNMAVIVIRDNKEETPEMTKRLDYTIGIIKNSASRVIELRPVGKTLLARMVSLIYILDYISFYLGLLYGVDPADTTMIENLKNYLRDKESQSK
ncbi:MAG: bifunctional phosphoglucose/phosphomannose isomerase [Candidatus Micrarchaeota archaeon]|nr:bifunctional phosphoglucose/phosphomannose isomerase [Candidatus Micrarchaeota archaeon]